ncbi:MAG: MFS transporter [Bdellovibrionaceae bacterium]|nr:MFS transporter [Pseudobdellovibrionaceae bacterium]
MRRNLHLSLWDAFFFSIMVGAGESFLPAFAIHIGFSDTLTGLFSTVPLAAGAIVQLLTPWGLRRVGSVRRWVVAATAVQATALLPLVFWEGLGLKSAFALFAIAAIYWGAGYAAGPVWNRWMADLVPQNVSASFFAKRLSISQYGVLLGLLVSGAALQYGLNLGIFTSAFSLIFLVAFASRAGSSFLLSMKEDSGTEVLRQKALPAVLKSVMGRGYERALLVFLFLFGASIFISSPFVNPFLLKQLAMSNSVYTFCLIALFLGKIVGYSLTHRYLGGIATERTLILGALGISPMPALWMFCTGGFSAGALQFTSGLCWGVYESALTLILFRRVSSESKVALLTIINFVQCAAILLGSLVGGSILKAFGENFQAYVVVFGWSSLLRVLVCVLFSMFWIGWPLRLPSRDLQLLNDK